MLNQRWFLISGLLSIELLAMSSSASASVVVLTGGDSDNGLALDSANVIYAVAPAIKTRGNPGAVQGVTFAENNANVTIMGAVNDYTGSGTFASTETSTNDAHLLTLINDARYNGPDTISGTISNLTPSGQYVLDYLLTDSSGGAFTRSVTISSTGTGSPITDSIAPATVQTVVYDIHQNVQADDLGNISFTDTAGQPFANAILSAVVVTAVPEPTLLAAVGLGAWGLIARRRF